MNAIRRILALILLTVAVIVGASLPASAALAASVTVPTTITTITAPATVTVNGYCQGTWYYGTVSWSAGTTPRGVSGYRVLAYLKNGTVSVVGGTNASTRSLSTGADVPYLAYQPRVTVMTLTSYGWTAESAKSGIITC